MGVMRQKIGFPFLHNESWADLNLLGKIKKNLGVVFKPLHLQESISAIGRPCSLVDDLFFRPIKGHVLLGYFRVSCPILCWKIIESRSENMPHCFRLCQQMLVFKHVSVCRVSCSSMFGLFKDVELHLHKKVSGNLWSVVPVDSSHQSLRLYALNVFCFSTQTFWVVISVSSGTTNSQNKDRTMWYLLQMEQFVCENVRIGTNVCFSFYGHCVMWTCWFFGFFFLAMGLTEEDRFPVFVNRKETKPYFFFCVLVRIVHFFFFFFWNANATQIAVPVCLLSPFYCLVAGLSNGNHLFLMKIIFHFPVTVVAIVALLHICFVSGQIPPLTHRVNRSHFHWQDERHFSSNCIRYRKYTEREKHLYPFLVHFAKL